VNGLSWGRVDSPLGPLHVGVSARGLARILLPSEDSSRVVPRASRGLVDATNQLEEYFAGERREFTMPVDWSLARGFRLRALEEIGRIPYGETVTYRELARRAGNERAARAAGHACAMNPLPIVLPCHRVVRSDGDLNWYTGGLQNKELLLRLEGLRLTYRGRRPRVAGAVDP
jgi:methylated-DNA-[protein]-cysteine S-methyltransferase